MHVACRSNAWVHKHTAPPPQGGCGGLVARGTSPWIGSPRHRCSRSGSGRAGCDDAARSEPDVAPRSATTLPPITPTVRHICHGRSHAPVHSFVLLGMQAPPPQLAMSASYATNKQECVSVMDPRGRSGSPRQQTWRRRGTPLTSIAFPMTYGRRAAGHLSSQAQPAIRDMQRCVLGFAYSLERTG